MTILTQYQPEKLSEDILTIPNVLTILRLASTPVLGYLVIIDEMPYALGLLALSGFTDVLDGWLARRYKSATVFGSIADPAADKALMTVMVGALAWRGLMPSESALPIRFDSSLISTFQFHWSCSSSEETWHLSSALSLFAIEVFPSQRRSPDTGILVFPLQKLNRLKSQNTILFYR